jgi:hypothetical protein
LAYKTFEKHAALTGNATSQGYLAFFHATGFLNVVPVDQAKAQLYYTFAANGGDKAAQMALGYRYWTGIGVVENCEHAVEWYSAAAEKGKPGIPSWCSLLTFKQQWHASYLARLADARFHWPQLACLTLRAGFTVQAQVWHRRESLGSDRLSKLLAPVPLAKHGKISWNIILSVVNLLLIWTMPLISA